jgi:WD40 repeat protein
VPPYSAYSICKLVAEGCVIYWTVNTDLSPIEINFEFLIPSIKVWSVESLTSEYTYRPAHLHQVSCVCSHPQDGSSVFASCSLDGMGLIWDTRKAKPATGRRIVCMNTVYGLGHVCPSEQAFILSSLA